jgi:signal transduction histidine kinase
MPSSRTVANPPSWPSAAFAVVFATATLIVPGVTRAAITGEPAIEAGDAIGTFVWVALEAAVLMAALRWSERRGRDVLQSVAISVALTASCGAVISLALAAFGGGGTLVGGVPAAVLTLIGGAFDACIILGAWTLAYILPRAVHAARTREREHHELRAAAQRARLRAALEPHFVLNTLNAIASLVGEDAERARQLIGDLGDLLRDVVRNTELAAQPVRDEISWLRRYTQVLETRHEGRLRVHFTVDPRVTAHQVPVLLVQPLIENAIQHGALQRVAGGQVWIGVDILNEELRWTIRDDGPGFSPEPRGQGGSGLALVRRRLEIEAPGSKFTVDSQPGGSTVTVTLPPAFAA